MPTPQFQPYSDNLTAISSVTGIGTLVKKADGTWEVTTLPVQSASVLRKGVVQLTDSTSSTSEDQAPTANALKKTYDIAIAAVEKTQKGMPYGVASLDKYGIVYRNQLPDYVVQYDSQADFPPEGDKKLLYLDKATNSLSFWDGSTYRHMGVSGYSGFSGYSGESGFSGFSGISGFSGTSGYSGFSGLSGESGFSGYSGISGFSGLSGFSGYSGFSGMSGATGLGFAIAKVYSSVANLLTDTNPSGIIPGQFAIVDTDVENPENSRMYLWNGSSYQYINDFSGGIGISGASGISGYSGFSGFSGASGISGFSGYSGFSGISGASGFSGTSGFSGYSGASGVSGFSGTSGFSGLSGASGYSGFSGVDGQSGYSGFSGKSGYSGATGASGISGFSGYSGANGATGSQGVSGFSGYSGIQGIQGISGFSGYSGANGATGSPGISGFSGFSGYSGTNGSNGTSGYSGYSGTNGVIGSDGASGFSGYSGYSGFPGATGASGYSGYSGIAGPGNALTTANDTTTTTLYPVMVSAVGSTSQPVATPSKLSYNAATGILSTTGFNSLSDANHKKNVKTIENAIEKVRKIRGVSYEMIDIDLPEQIGVIAQEVEQVIPQVVSTDQQTGIKTVSYGNIVALLIEAIKDQDQRILALESNKY